MIMNKNNQDNIEVGVEFNNISSPFSEDELVQYSKKMLSYAVEHKKFSDKFNIDSIENYKLNFDLMLCNNDFIKQINSEYRNIDASTDVITFAIYSDSEDTLIVDSVINLGQIIISVDKALSQAEEFNIAFNDELLNLLAHGVLHLLGLDHKDEESLKLMLDFQDEMIKVVKNV